MCTFNLIPFAPGFHSEKMAVSRETVILSIRECQPILFSLSMCCVAATSTLVYKKSMYMNDAGILFSNTQPPTPLKRYSDKTLNFKALKAWA